MAAIGIVAIIVAAQFANGTLGWFVAGTMYGAGLVFWMTAFELIDPASRHWIQGAEGEEMTARELRRCRRDGWRSVHHMHLHAGDIDHLVVGPGGVVALETKHSGTDWAWLCKNRRPGEWARQAKTAAFRGQALVGQHTGLRVDVEPIVVVWAHGLAGVEPTVIDGVRFVHGRDIASTIRSREATLTSDQVRRIADALEPVARAYADRLGNGRSVPARA